MRRRASSLFRIDYAFMAILPLLLLGGCCGRSHTPPAAGGARVSEETSSRYRVDVTETATLVAQYVRQWEQHGAWPAAGTYNTAALIYKGTEPDSSGFPDRRRDFYRTLFDGGRELDVNLYDDGIIAVDIFQDREPQAAARQ